MTAVDRDDIALTLHHAARKVRLVAQPSTTTPFDVAAAYDIQQRNIAHRVAEGHAVVGYKMGLTSKAKMEQMGVPHPIYGVLTADMQLHPDQEVDRTTLSQPRIEPEIAFVLGQPLSGPTTLARAEAAVSTVHAALEVINSRYANFKFTLEDVVADNASSSYFVLGEVARRPGDIDLGNLGMVMEKDGAVAAVGNSAAILEHPLRSLVELCNMMAERSMSLPAGAVVLAGGATQAIPFDAGSRVQVRVDQLGTVGLRMSSPPAMG